MYLQPDDWYTARYHGVNDSANQAMFRAAISFALGGTNRMFRITEAYVTHSPAGVTRLLFYAANGRKRP